MKKIITYLMLFELFCLLFYLPTVLSQDKLAQTGFQFLSVGTSARATAMGEAYTTISRASDALFYNPAGLAGTPHLFDISFNQMKWIADINYLSGSISLNFKNGQYGVFGMSFMAIDYGEFFLTRVASNEQGFEDITGSTPDAFVVGGAYARQLSDRFFIGSQIKYTHQKLGESLLPVYSETDTSFQAKDYALGTVALDFGTIYKTGFKSLVFGMSVRNFSREIKYEKEGFQLPLTFKIGISMDLMDFVRSDSDQHLFLLSIDAVHPRSYPEFLNIGLEYNFINLLALRAGYISNHEEYNFAYGFGVRKFGLSLDFSYTPFYTFNDITRLSVNFTF